MSLARLNGTATAFSYDAAGNVARLEATGPAGALILRYDYAYDGRGSVAQTLGASGTVSSWHMWGAFGSQEAGSSLGELPSYGYNAEEAHPQTGLQYLRARYYDAESGRFGVQDSYLGQTSDPLTLNRYLYCLSDPLNLIDPSGHWGTKVSSAFGFDSIGRTIAQAFGPKYPQINVTVPLVPDVTPGLAQATTGYALSLWYAKHGGGIGGMAGMSSAAYYAAQAEYYR